MKTLKIVLAAAAGLIGLVLIVAAIAPKEFGAVREVTIDRPAPAVFNYVKYLKHQDVYSVWARKDPQMVKEYRGTDGTVGFVSAWDSKMEEVGKGEQEIKAIIDGARIDYELRFTVPVESRSDAFMIIEPLSQTQSKVKWGFKGRMPYPMNLMLLTMDMEGSIGGDLAAGLANLKTTLEK
jgi:hypothetical protein